MDHFHTESLPMINLLQKACETLVVKNHLELATEYNVVKRADLIKEANEADKLVDHFRELIKNNSDV